MQTAEVLLERTARQRIIAPREHFLAHGFHNVTMDDLADGLGMSKKTITLISRASPPCWRPCCRISSAAEEAGGYRRGVFGRLRHGLAPAARLRAAACRRDSTAIPA